MKLVATSPILLARGSCDGSRIHVPTAKIDTLMNHHALLSARGTSWPPAAIRSDPNSRWRQAGGLTLGGIWLLGTGLLVVGSGLASFRPVVGGMMVHPYLVALLAVAPLVLLLRIYDFPLRPLVGMATFFGLFAISSLDPGSLPFIVKLGAGLATVVVTALLVRSRADFLAGAVGLTLAVGILAIRGIATEETVGGGAHVIDQANKNNFSLYALPAMLLTGHIVTRFKTSRLLKAVLVACVLGMLAAIFMSANRSGYVGAAVVAVLVFRERRIWGLILVICVAGGLIYWLKHYGTTATFEQRVQETTEGNDSDHLRVALLKAALRIGLDHPLLGISQGGLTLALDQEVEKQNGYHGAGPHNVIGAVVGGSGLLCFAALVYLGWSLWFWPVPGRPGQPPPAEFLEARLFLRCMMVLWLVRGQFTDEILYAPGFCLGLGLAIGLCIAADHAASQTPEFTSPLLPLGTRAA